MEKLQQQIKFLQEIDKLKDVFRQSLIINGKREENDAEHSWHMAMTAIVLKEYFIEEVDMEKTLKMILIHDLVEIYAGDTPAFGAVREDKFQAELESAKKLFSILPKDQEEEFLNLWLEFEEVETSESKFANVCDKVQGFMQNMTSNGHTWRKFSPSVDKILERVDPVKKYAPEVFNKMLLPEIEKYMKLGVIRK